jgi:hypothetical protein
MRTRQRAVPEVQLCARADGLISRRELFLCREDYVFAIVLSVGFTGDRPAEVIDVRGG